MAGRFELDKWINGSLMLEDTLLKLRFNRGDKDALRRIYEKYKDDLLRLAAALLNDVNLAEDVLNDTFLSFTRSMGQLRVRGNLKSFLATCVVNHARNVHRADKRKRTVALDEAMQVRSNDDGPGQAVIFDEECQRLNDAMSRLGCEQREVVILHCYNGLKFKTIAKLQDISVNTAKSRYRYGLNKLSKLLNSEFEK